MSSLTAISHLVHTNAKLDDFKSRLAEPMTNEGLLTLSSQLQPLYKTLLITNLDDALARQLEISLWTECFKTPLSRFGRSDKNLFHLVIEAGVGFYLGLIQDIGIHFDISFITNATCTNKFYCTKTSQSPLVSPSKSSVYYIIQNCLLHVGDLLRYRGSFPEAIKMYDKSAAVCPSNGYPHHQMGTTQLLIIGNDDYTTMNNLVSAFYYYSRALAVSNSHEPALLAFDSITAKILSLPVGSNRYQEFIRQFLLMIASILRKDILPPTFTYNVVPMLSPLVINQQIKPSILFQMICIALWTEWHLNKEGNGEFTQNEEAILEIIVAMLNSILIAGVGLFGGDDYPMANVDRRFYSAVHLKMLMDWLSRLYRSDKAGKRIRFLRDKVHMSNLVKVMNLIRQSVHFEDDENCSFILPEEKRLIGFLPLDYSSLRAMGAQLVEDNNSKTNMYRLQRIIKSAMTIAHPHQSSGINSFYSLTSKSYSFLSYNGTEFTEPASYGISPMNQLPSRRNVALTSIFRSGVSGSGASTPVNGNSAPNAAPSLEFGDADSSFGSSIGAGGGSPTTSMTSLSPMPEVFNCSLNSTNTNYLSFNSNSSPSDPFRSIWTPNSEPKTTNEDSTWN